jgi:hypothetical protein
MVGREPTAAEDHTDKSFFVTPKIELGRQAGHHHSPAWRTAATGTDTGYRWKLSSDGTADHWASTAFSHLVGSHSAGKWALGMLNFTDCSGAQSLMSWICIEGRDPAKFRFRQGYL